MGQVAAKRYRGATQEEERHASTIFELILRLGVLSGGSDVPGINAAIKALVYRARDDGMSVLGIRGGW